MKNQLIHSLIFAGTLLIGASSCKKTFMDPAINVNPNSSGIASDASLLPSIIVPVAYNTGGSLSWYTSMLDQQTVGVSNQFSNFSAYITSTSDYDNIWANIYQNCLINATILNKQATAEGNLYYAGITKVLIAYQMGLTTDLWGDVPFSQAFKGASGNTTPVFDKQQDIYVSLFKLLDSAKSQLGSANGGANTPTTDDVSSYHGNNAQWLKLANLMTARLAIHLSKVDPTYAQKAIDAIAAGAFASNADNFSVTFGTDGNSNNPNFQLGSQRGGYFSYGGSGTLGTPATASNYIFLPHQMFLNNDPRLAVYVTAYDDPSASAADVGDYFGSQNTPAASVNLVTYAEQNFILAEAYNRQGNAAAAQTAYAAALTASFNQFTLDATAAGMTYINANSLLPADPTAALQQIMTQKYFALYLNPEVYTDWRRTGYPALSSAVAGVAIPRRFLYPLQEYSYNKANVPAGINLTSRVYWDK